MHTEAIAAVLSAKLLHLIAPDKPVGAVAVAFYNAAEEIVSYTGPSLKATEPGSPVSDGTIIVAGHEIPPQHLLIIDTRTGQAYTSPTWTPTPGETLPGAVAATAGLPGWPAEEIDRAYSAWLTDDTAPEVPAPAPYSEDRT